MVVGDARMASNKRRARWHDRGAKINRHVDLHGAFGEVVMYHLVSELVGSELVCEQMANNLYHPGGGRKTSKADVNFFDDVLGLDITLDCKTFDCAPNKKFFALNEKKHQKLSGLGGQYYIGILAPTFGKKAAVSRLIPLKEVDEWKVRRFGKHCDPSHNKKLEEFGERFFSKPIPFESMREKTHDEDKVIKRTQDAKFIARCNSLCPNLESFLAA